MKKVLSILMALALIGLGAWVVLADEQPESRAELQSQKPQTRGCQSNADGCNKTLANLACGGKSWDPDGDGNYTCKP